MLADAVILSMDNMSTNASNYIEIGSSSLGNFFQLSWFIGFNANTLQLQRIPYSEAYLTMLASENVLSRDWNQPEEDEAWENL